MFDTELPAAQLLLWSPDETSAGWTVRESPRARRLAVRVLHTGAVEVVVPRRTSQRMIATFLARHRQWIDRKRSEAQVHARPAQPFPPQRIELPACGESLRVHLAGGSGRPRAARLAPGVISLRGDITDPRAIRLAMRQWLTATAGDTLAPLLASTARELGLRYSKVVIRRQRNRWGSCSTRGTISLNCCLLFQRLPVVRYLLIHELAHTVHMNHSRAFWQCVAGFCAEYQRLDRELADGWRQVPAWVFND